MAPTSRRADWDLSPNDFARHVAARRASGRPFDDLTESNPTRCGLIEPAEALRSALAGVASDARALVYEPDPRGLRVAREAIAQDLAARGDAIDCDRIVLTAGTSEGYAHLFRLLADPGDDVLVPAPGYPLFDYIAGVEGLDARCYPLARDAAGGFVFDPEAVCDAIGPRTRAVVVVHPANPTGSRLDAAAAARLRAICAERDLALLSDEVFADFVDTAAPPALRSLLADADADPAPLTFVLSGVSKALALPQAKLAWIVASGPAAARDEALARLDVLSDTFLTLATPGQLLLPPLLARRPQVQRELLARLAQNRSALARALDGARCLRALPVHAGWNAILALRPPNEGPPGEDELVRALLDEADVLVLPGWLFDLEPSPEDPCAHLVLSLLPPADRFAEAVHRLVVAAERIVTGESA